jgi:hypothetical protein
MLSVRQFELIPELAGNPFLPRLFEMFDADKDNMLTQSEFNNAVDHFLRSQTSEERLKCTCSGPACYPRSNVCLRRTATSLPSLKFILPELLRLHGNVLRASRSDALCATNTCWESRSPRTSCRLVTEIGEYSRKHSLKLSSSSACADSVLLSCSRFPHV